MQIALSYKNKVNTYKKSMKYLKITGNSSSFQFLPMYVFKIDYCISENLFLLQKKNQ